MKPTKCQAREKNEARKERKKGGEKAKSKSQDCCVTSKFCFLCMPELLDPKAAKCTTCKQLCGKF